MHGSMDAWMHGCMQSCSHAIMQSCNSPNTPSGIPGRLTSYNFFLRIEITWVEVEGDKVLGSMIMHGCMNA